MLSSTGPEDLGKTDLFWGKKWYSLSYSFGGWWFQPIRKKNCSSKWVHLPQVEVKIKNI